jgi:hypothetical protein
MTASERCFAGALLLLLAACSDRGPKDALDRYREALERKDARAMLALSERSLRESMTEEELRAYLDAQTTVLSGIAGDLAGPPTRLRRSAEVILKSGRRIVLVEEDGAWRIAEGAVELARFDTPEHALTTFFAATLARRWATVRRAIPKRFVDALSSDDALAKHVEAMRPRIDRARVEIGVAMGGRVELRGERALLAYGEGKKVTFEREDGAWKVLDLE